MNAEQFRNLFPFFGEKRDGRGVTYFDNAATSQRPFSVIDKLNDCNVRHNANIHRALHTLSVEATEAFEASRDTAARFINAPSREEVIFTSGTTAGINLVAYSFGAAFVKKGDEIIVGAAEHHSNLVPWQLLALRSGAAIRWCHPSSDGSYRVQDIAELLSPRTRLVCIAHASNVLGRVNPVREIVALAHGRGVPVLVDGAQGAVHLKVDVQALDCDFYAFSAHKLLGPTGVGILYGKRQWLEEMPPFLAGGEMIGDVSLQGSTYAPLPLKFEAGTQNFINVAALAPALDLMDRMLSDKELNGEFDATAKWLLSALRDIPGLTLYGDDGSDLSLRDRLPLFSFTVKGIHHQDIAILLDRMGIAVRSGQMCAEPLMRECGTEGMVRASLLPYNTRSEAGYFVSCLDKAIGMLR